MKNAVTIFFSLVFFAACGGGGSSESPAQPAPTPAPPPVNTAPTITGLSAISAKAKVNESIVVTANDAEEDTLTVSIEDKPEWIAIEQTNNQITISVEAGFLDIGQYTYSLEVSDGKESSSYSLSVTIEDNPAEYTFPQFNKVASFLRVWLMDNGEMFILYDDMSGFHKNIAGEYFRITWAIDFSGFRVNIYSSLNRDTPIRRVFFEALAKEGNHFRLAAFENNEEQYKINTIEPSQRNLETAVFSKPYDLSSPTIQLKEDMSLNGSLRTTTYQSPSFTFSARLTTDGAIEINEATASSIRTETFHKRQMHSGSDDLNFVRQLNELSIAYYDGELLILKAKWNHILEDENIVVSDFGNRLREFLDTPDNRYYEIVQLTPEPFPEISLGDKFLSRFNANLSIERFSAFNSINQLVFDSTTEGRLILDVPPPYEQTIEVPIQWRRIGSNQLEITESGISQIYSLYKNHKDLTVLYGYISDFDNNLSNTAGFAKDMSISFTEEQLSGIYQNLTFTMSVGTNLINIKGDGFATYYYEENGVNSFDYLVQNSDGSFTITRRVSLCDDITSYSECLDLQQSLKANEEPYFIRVRKITPVEVEGDIIFLKHEILVDNNRISTRGIGLGSSLHVWQKLMPANQP